jgi:hypothetical protein
VTGSKKPPTRKKVDQWLAASPARERDYEKWASKIKDYSSCLKDKSGYKFQAGEVYTYAYFTERSLQALRPGGLLGYVVKLGLYGDEKVKKLRKHLLTSNKTTKMWLFAKNKFGDIKLFPKIDPNEKFMLFLTEKSKPAAKGEVAAKWVEEFNEISNKFEPWQRYALPEQLDDIFRVMVFVSARQKAISEKISKASTSVQEAGLSVVQELHQTNDRKHFTSTANTIPIYSGTELSPYHLEEATAWLREDSVLGEYESAQNARIAVNNILPNSRRKVRAAIVPEGVLTANSLLLVTGFTEELPKAFVLGCLNAMLTEYFLRPRLSNINLNNFRLLPLLSRSR